MKKMASYKFLICFLVASLAFDGLKAQSDETVEGIDSADFETRSIESLVSQAEAIIEKLEDDVKEFLENKTQEIEEHLSELKDKVKVEITKVENTIKTEVSLVKKEIRNAVEKVGETVSGVKNCADTGIKTIIHFPNNTLVELKSCVTDPIKEAETIVSQTVEAINNTLNEIESLKSSLNECQNKPLTAVKCLIGVINKAADAVTELPKVIQNSYNEGKALLTNLLPNVEKCLKQKAEDAVTNIQNVGKNTVDCIKKLIV